MSGSTVSIDNITIVVTSAGSVGVSPTFLSSGLAAPPEIGGSTAGVGYFAGGDFSSSTSTPATIGGNGHGVSAVTIINTLTNSGSSNLDGDVSLNNLLFIESNTL